MNSKESVQLFWTFDILSSTIMTSQFKVLEIWKLYKMYFCTVYWKWWLRSASSELANDELVLTYLENDKSFFFRARSVRNGPIIFHPSPTGLRWSAQDYSSSSNFFFVVDLQMAGYAAAGTRPVNTCSETKELRRARAVTSSGCRPPYRKPK